MGPIALLGVLTLASAPAPVQNFACSLGAGMGRGLSSLGRIDTLSSLEADCSYTVLRFEAWSLAPRLGLLDQNWTLARTEGGFSQLSTFQARSLAAGLALSYNFGSWELFYSLSSAQGSGQFDETFSSPSSRQTAHFSKINHRMQAHALGAQQQLTPYLGLAGSIQRSFARQDWDAAAAGFEGEAVDENNHLTLTSTPIGLIGPQTQDATFASWELKLSVELRLD